MRYIRLFLALFLLLAAPAWGGTLALVLSDGSKPYRDFQETLAQALNEANWRIVIVTQDVAAAQAANPDLIIAVGSDALRRTLARTPTQASVATLLTHQSYEKILAESPAQQRRGSAIFLDQPPARLAAFARHLLPEAKHAGMLFSADTRGLLARYQSSFQNRNLRLDYENVDNDTLLLPALNQLLPRIDFLLTTPDTTLYHRGSLKSLFISALRAQKAVLGFSESMTNAGALAAIYSTPAQIARQAAQWLPASANALPPPTNATYFTVSINQNVAQSLELKVSDEASLLKAIQAEGEFR